MKKIYSNIFKVNNKNLSKALNCLKKKQLVGVPTETVYGLAGNAYSRESVGSIYALKKRPYKNPLIIHYYDLKRLEKDAYLNKKFFKLYKAFCPGPITFILKKKKDSLITNLATSGLKTIAVRFPNNKIIRKILKQLKFPLAIPSANKSTKVSPVSAQDVSVDFGGSLKLILDDGSCDIGIESTVVDLTSKVKILRPGFVNPKEIGKVLKCKVTIDKKSLLIKSPGMLKRHYSPGIPMKLNQDKAKNNQAFLVYGKNYKKGRHIFNLSYKSNLNEAARNLYKTLRLIKKKKYKIIYVSKIPNKNIGIALNDRLTKAAR
jgi:L-threonylcarbamoyladenylate synthase